MNEFIVNKKLFFIFIFSLGIVSNFVFCSDVHVDIGDRDNTINVGSRVVFTRKMLDVLSSVSFDQRLKGVLPGTVLHVNFDNQATVLLDREIIVFSDKYQKDIRTRNLVILLEHLCLEGYIDE